MKIIRNLFRATAFAIGALGLCACSNDDAPSANPDFGKTDKIVTLTTTLTSSNRLQTRSEMTDNGDGTITTTWQVNDLIYVKYKNTSNEDVVTMAAVTAVDETTKAATITASMTNPLDGGNIFFGFPFYYWSNSKTAYEGQTGTLDCINENYAAVSGSGTVSVSGSDATLPTGVAMEPETCIWKFSFTDGTNDITADVTKLQIYVGDEEMYEVTPSTLSTIYVAMYPADSKSITIKAQTASQSYTISKSGITLENGKMYTSASLALTARYPIALGSVTVMDIGSVIGSDANIYQNAAAASAAGTTAQAMIAYIGTASNCTHGLAIAMEDAASEVPWTYLSSILSTWTNSHAIKGGSWRIPSLLDWEYMFIGCGSKDTPSSNPKPTNFDSIGFQTLLATVGGTAINVGYSYYWTSDTKWCYYGNGMQFVSVNSSGNYRARACFVF